MQEQTKSTEGWHIQLIRAAKNGDDDALQSLSSITDINLEDKDGRRAVDYAWENQHYKVVLSLLKRDSVFPHRFDLELKNNTGEWKDLKKFVEERDRLHKSVKDGIVDQVRTNCSSTKSKYFLNSENQSLLYTAIMYQKFEISDYLESIGAKFIHKNEKCAADELISKTVNDNINDFVKYFVKEFETKLQGYHLILEGEIKKPGKLSDTFSEKIGKGIGAAGGGLIGLALGMPAVGANLGAKGGQAIAGKVGNYIGSEHNRKTVITLKGLVDDAQNNETNFRRKLVEDGVDIFQSYEVQFMRATTDQGPKQAMQLLARDATNRIISCYRNEKDIKNVVEGVVSGTSKVKSVLGVPIPTAKIKSPGFTIYYGSCKEQWSTASLFKKVGLVREETYYENKDGKSRVDKYGCRRLFKSEDWDNLKASWNALGPSDVRCRFKNYKYALNSRDSKIQTIITNILENINDNDENLKEERIKDLLNDNKNEIIEAINSLKEQSQGYVEDRKILTNLANNLQNLNVDEYLKKFKQYFEEAKAEREEIAKSIKAGKADNKKDHQKTHEKLDSMLLLLAAEEKEKTKEPIWFDVREPIDHFSGREKELTDLHNKIHRKPENPTVISQMTAISGLGGIGKTELAAQFIKEHATDFENVIWVNAENEATLQESFRRLAKDTLKIQTEDANGKEKDIKSVVRDVYTFFRKRKTLIIFDNAENKKGFENFLPLKSLPRDSEKPYILFTSRNREWAKGIEVIHLKELTLQDAIDLVKKKLNVEHECQRQEIKALAEKLQCFPLAIHQAIAYIEDQQVTGAYNISDYLEEYEKKTQDLLESEAFMDFTNDYNKTTFTTWRITIDRIVNDKEHGELASDILNAIAYLAPEHINRDMFLVTARGNATNLKSAVRLLVKYSMLNGEEQQNVLNIHRLVQEVIRLELKRKSNEEQVLKDVFELLKEKFHSKNEKLDYAQKRQMLIHLEVFTSHIDERKKKQQNNKNIELGLLENLLNWISFGYFELGDPVKVKAFLEKKLAIGEEHYGSENFRFAPIIVNLGNAYGDLGDPQKEKEFLEMGLAIQEKHYGSEHFQVAITLANLSNAYGELGDPQKKKELLERALAIQEKHYGSDNFQVAITLASLGSAYDDLGDHQKAKQFLERALAIQEKHYGSEHYLLGPILGNLGSVYGALGDTRKKKELLEKALAIEENHYGSENFHVAITLAKLGNVYGDLGDSRKNQELLERALAIKENHYGSENFQIAPTLVNLGNAYGDLGDPVKKKELLARALTITEKHYGSEHFEVAFALVNLGNAYGKLGDPQKQKEFLERALAIQEKRYGSEHFQVAITLASLGSAYNDLGDHQKHKTLLERALAIQEKHYGSEHFLLSSTIVNLGNAYGALGNPQKHKKLLERALAIQENHYGSDNFHVAITLANLGIVYGDLRDHQKAKQFLERALAIKEKHYGSEHFEVAITLGNLGNAYGALGHPQKKKEFLERALAIQEKHYGSEHFEVANTLVNLGNAYGDLSDHQKAKQFLERALAIKEKHYGSEHFQVAITLANLGLAYGTLGDRQKEKEFLERSLAIQETHYGSEHFIVAITLANLGNAYGAIGDSQKRKTLLERALAIQENHYGSENFQIAPTLVSLGHAYGDFGDPQKKKELLERALAIIEKRYGSEHFKVALVLLNLGNAHGELGDPQKKKEFLERALAIQEKHYGSEHFQVAITLAYLGCTYGVLGDRQKEKDFLERALAIQETHYGSEHFMVAITLGNLGNAYGAIGDPQKRKTLLERALAIQENHYGSEHFQLAPTLVNLGNAYGDLGDPRKKKELLERVLAIKEKRYGLEHFQLIPALVNLGNAYSDLGDLEKKSEFFERALAIQEKH